MMKHVCSTTYFFGVGTVTSVEAICWQESDFLLMEARKAAAVLPLVQQLVVLAKLAIVLEAYLLQHLVPPVHSCTGWDVATSKWTF